MYFIKLKTNFFSKIAVELPKPSQSHYMALDDRARSQVIADASPLSTEQTSEYASLDPHTCSCEIPREHVTIKKIVGKVLLVRLPRQQPITYKEEPRRRS